MPIWILSVLGSIRRSMTQRRAVEHAASGALSGVLVASCLQPFDVLRTRMQADATTGLSTGALRTVRGVLRLFIGSVVCTALLSIALSLVSNMFLVLF